MDYFFMTQVAPRNSLSLPSPSSSSSAYIHLELKDVEYCPARDFLFRSKKGGEGLFPEH